MCSNYAIIIESIYLFTVNRSPITRDRTLSEASSVSTSSRKPLAGLEKSTKDLQRQTISLMRLKTTLNDEVERSFKNISKVFEELRKQYVKLSIN